MKISQTPAGTSSRIACTRPSQPLKSPIDADAIGVGRPDGEMHAGGRADRDPVRAELLEDAKVPALAEQVEIEIGEDASVPVRIVDLDHVIAGKREAKAVVEGAGSAAHARLRGLDHHLEETGRPAPAIGTSSPVADQPELDRAGGGMERPHDDAAAASSAMRTEHGERIAVHPVRQGHEGLGHRGRR